MSQLSEGSIEQEIKNKRLDAPRLTPEYIDEQIVEEAYYVFPGTCLTVCALTLRNGYHVVGESAPASPENFDEALGRKIARDHARNKIWALEGYLLRTTLAALKQMDIDHRQIRRMSMDFGDAIRALKDGSRVARAGWNGKGMWLSLSNNGTTSIHADGFWSKNNADYARSQPDGCATVLPSITMKTATGEILMGWLASQTDMLAEDWQIVAD